MIADGYVVGDGTWQLRLYVTDLKVERTLRVRGDLHIGGVMLRLVEDLDVAIDWSDHALWWPEKNIWLSRTRSTLDQYGVQADALLHFTPMHKTLRIQMPDLQYVDLRTDFSIKTFSTVMEICRNLNIRHPEEMSLCRPLQPEHLKRNYNKLGCTQRQRTKDSSNAPNQNSSISTPEKTNPDVSNMSGPLNATTPWQNNGRSYSPSTTMLNGSQPESILSNYDLSQSPRIPSNESKQTLLYPKSLVERARLNAGWMDSSLSLMEQDVREYDTLLLKFKFFSFFDLNPKFDSVRINQIYEQAKWSILTETIDCTEEEMMVFSALHLQVNLQANVPQPDLYPNSDDDIDAALTDLQATLEGTQLNYATNDLTHVPELSDYLLFMKPKRFTLKGFRRCYAIFKDTHLSLYKGKDASKSAPILSVNLKGSEVMPDVNLGQNRFGIRLEVPNHEGMTEYWIRCDSEEKYAKWIAACRLAAKGKTMADSSYDSEVKSILDFLNLQKPAPALLSSSQIDISPEECVAPRFIRKLKSKQIINRILEAHAKVKDLTLLEAKLHFIKAWQGLPEYGTSLFVIKFSNCNKEELLGISFNRLMRMELSSGDHIKTWRYNTMKAWNVNWEVKQMRVQFEEENVAFSCLSADCKVVHEFIGGYIFLSMRSKDQNQTINEDLFLKLTGELNPGPKRQATLTNIPHSTPDQAPMDDLKLLIINLSAEVNRLGEKMDARLLNIEQKMEVWERRMAGIETSMASCTDALATNTRLISHNTLKIRNLEERAEALERRARENNLIIYGIESAETDSRELLLQKVKKLMAEDMQITDDVVIAECHRLGRGPKAPILIEVPDHETRISLLKNSFKLRMLNIFMSRDYSPQIREQRKILIEKRKELYKKGIGSKLRENKLLLNGINYMVVEGQVMNAKGELI
ncbi:FERMT2 [Cordylochernes scorpioides]|uniref:FERMT2 n=1 Tax=Cordylochernes scorpioides TaxID=51811 RepID=A0ABY6LL15_9ARAC|nr:FERMT2 [Cordylochernes scorpioides]